MTKTRPAATAEQLAAAIRNADRHGLVKSQVADLLRKQITGDGIPRMIVHPLGFYCVHLHRADSWGLCVHIWLDGGSPQPPTTSSIHYHTWRLESHVLYGHIENQIIRVEKNSLRPKYRVCRIISDDEAQVDRIEPTDELVTSTPLVTKRYTAGQKYVVGARQYHQSTCLDHRFTATVMLAENCDDSPQHALGAIDGVPHTYHRIRCPQTQTTQVVEKLLSRISPG